MYPKVSRQFTDLCFRLKAVDWFSGVGTHADLRVSFRYIFVQSEVDARRSIEGSEWQAFSIERRNDTTLFLTKRFPSRDAYWNVFARAAKEFLNSEIDHLMLPKLSHILPGSEIALAAVRWDIVSALIEACYWDCKPPFFFNDLMLVYEAGHLPVGWLGSKESGALLVF